VGGLTRGLTGLLRHSARLVPAGRREWVEALWAEAGQVPPGLARAAWRAGGLRLIAREALPARRAARVLVFAAAAVWVVHAAWRGPAGNPATAVNRLDVVTVVAVLAGLPLLARWLFGPGAPGWMARVLRSGAYAAVLVLTVAKAGVEQVRDNPAALPRLSSDASVPVKDGMIDTWLVESIFLLVIGLYVAAILAATARRPRVAPATLAAGTGAGLVLGAVMYTVAPLGLASHATDPWLHGWPIGLVVLLAWVLLFGGPVLAAVAAVRCYRGPGSPEQIQKAKIRQAVAAGFLATAVGALIVAVLGSATIALMSRAGWVLHWLYPGQHLPAAVSYAHELAASVRADNYGMILLVFPVIGLLMGLAGGGLAAPAALADPPPGGGGPPRPPGHPAPDPPGGIRLATVGADWLAARPPGLADDGPYTTEPALPRAG
jgi:heme/copper-type cytochrome/quinol oxidase subunit 2